MTAFLPGLRLPAIVQEIQTQIPESAGAYVVGGAVRDTLLQHPVHDIDITLAGDGIAAARRLADAFHADYYPLDSERGVGRVITIRDGARFTIDFATQRGADILADLTCRDFTINAMAVPLHRWEQGIDPLSGAADLLHKHIRACTDTSVVDDPVRSIRAVRLAAQLEFLIEPATRELVRSGAAGLVRVSAERIRDEFFRILAGRKTAAAVRVAHSLGLLRFFLPEAVAMEVTAQLPTESTTVWEHTLLALDRLEILTDVLTGGGKEESANNLTMGLARVQLGKFQPVLAERLLRPISDDRSVRGLVAMAMLLHDARKSNPPNADSGGKTQWVDRDDPGVEKVNLRGTALRFSNDEIQFMAAIVHNHIRPVESQPPAPIARRAIYRYYRATRSSGVEARLVAMADMLAAYGPALPTDVWRETIQTTCELWEAYFEHAAEIINPSPLLTGNDLIREFQMTPGPAIGEMLDSLREAQAAGEVTAREEASALVGRILNRPNQTP
jgi:tRNA nucleotidyltransferase/poly(A) polymerase